jgi:bacterioferritin
MNKSEFVLDVEKIRRQAKVDIGDGAVTDANTTDRQTLLNLLDGALATEWICVLRYSQHAAAAAGIHAEAIGNHFAEHAAQEWEHAQLLASRIRQLGGTPHLDPRHISRTAHSRYRECESLADMIKENLFAERIAVLSYTEMVRFVGEGDPTTRRILESILETEEEHADELAELLVSFDPREPIDARMSAPESEPAPPVSMLNH